MFENLIKIVVNGMNMTDDKNEIEKLIDTMISSGDDLVGNLKNILPDSLAESVVMFHESNVSNLKKIRAFLNK
ncbi:hypothetical protein NZNM25_01310 [Nitrosopumilus zosterae]|uniref:Uncharacterized protein n=2 Tax=Nitrosopumilaceae TaxID=338190 RepID=A0A2S2KNU5_9ARCH|nr:hypothetical protein NZNM25_01310 [Nitrosopumilus zosterae]